MVIHQLPHNAPEVSDGTSEPGFDIIKLKQLSITYKGTTLTTTANSKEIF
jgi:hypothetical protein